MMEVLALIVFLGIVLLTSKGIYDIIKPYIDVYKLQYKQRKELRKELKKEKLRRNSKTQYLKLV